GAQGRVDGGGFAGPQDVAHAVRDMGPLVVRIVCPMRLLDAAAVGAHQDLLVICYELGAGGCDLMANGLPARPEQEVDEVDAIPIRGILLRYRQADPESLHRCEEYLVISLPGLRVYVCPHGVTTENDFMPVTPEALFQALTHLWEGAGPEDD